MSTDHLSWQMNTELQVVSGHAGSIPNAVQCRSIRIKFQKLIQNMAQLIGIDRQWSLLIHIGINSWILIFIDQHWMALHILGIDPACPVVLLPLDFFVMCCSVKGHYTEWKFMRNERERLPSFTQILPSPSPPFDSRSAYDHYKKKKITWCMIVTCIYVRVVIESFQT